MSLLAGLLLAASAVAGPLVVMPPETSAEDAWLGTAVAQVLPHALESLGVPALERAERLGAQHALEIPAVAVTRATALRIAQAVGASRVVTGSADVKGSDVELSLRLLDGGQASLSAPLLASGSLESLPELLQGLAWDIALSSSRPPAGSRRDFVARAQGLPLGPLRQLAEALAQPDSPQRLRRLRAALSQAPGHDETRLELGRLLLEAREFTQAHDVLARLPRTSPLARRARFFQGVALIELGRYREATALYGDLLAERPGAAVLNNHGLALFRLGGGGVRPSAELRKALEVEPGFPDVAYNLGFCLLAEGEPEAALFWLRGVLAQVPTDARAHLVSSWALRRTGRAEEADRAWKSASDLASGLAPLQKEDVGRRLERILMAERPLLATAARPDPERVAEIVAGAERLLAAGDRAQALAELNRALHLDPHAPRAHLALSRLHRAAGDRERAVQELRMALWSREDAEVRGELVALLEELGRTAEAQAARGPASPESGKMIE